MGGPIRRGNFNKLAARPHAVEALGMPGLHVHDLRHTGNQFAANSGAGLRDLMARMGHDSERAAMIYQHEARGADRSITNAIDTHVEDEKRKDDDQGDATERARQKEAAFDAIEQGKIPSILETETARVRHHRWRQ